MNLRIIGLGGLLGIVVFMFSELLLISWTGEVTFYEPNGKILVTELLAMVVFMGFTSLLLVEEIKKKKISYRTIK